MIALFALTGSLAQAAVVRDVKVEGTGGSAREAGAVLSRCSVKAGEQYDGALVAADVRALRASGEFQDVSARANEAADGKIDVVYSVKRKLRYHAPAEVSGNDFYGVSKIISESGLKDGLLYGDADFETAAVKIRRLYAKKHFMNAKVEVRAKPMPDGINCKVEIVVEEGARSRIDSWEFDGAESVDWSELKSAIDVYPWWNPYSWFTDEPITENQLAQAAAKIEAYYAERGWLDVKVSGPEYVRSGEEKDGKAHGSLHFDIIEGPKYTVGTCTVSGVTRYSAADVAGKSDLPEEGSVAGSKLLEDAAHRVEVVVGSGDSGLAGSTVDVQWLPRLSDPTVLDIVFKVTEGAPVAINQIRIDGNDYTKDKVIRREIPLGPGNRMLSDRAEKGKKRLENLRYFSRVRYYLADSWRGKDASGAEYKDLVYEVEEKNTGNFMVGIGASSVDSVYVSAEVQQANFDLFAPSKYFRGGGQKARLYVAAGPRLQTYEASITEPWLFDRQLDFTVEGYRRQRWYDEYDLIRSGAAATLAYPVKFWPTWDPFGSFGVRLSGEFIEFDDPDHGYWLYNGRAVSLSERGGEDDRYGDAFETVVRLFWNRDTRDSFQFPKSGNRTRLFFDIGTGDNEYWRLGFNHRTYLQPWRKAVRSDSWLREHVFMLALRAETIDAFSDDVPIYNRFFLGGPKSIRGIEYRHVSPMARKLRGRDPDGDPSSKYTPWGGQTLACVNAEYTVPIVKMLRLAAFTDLGAIGEDEFDADFGDTFAWTVGLGVRIDIPMFPIRLDFGTPIEKPDHADKEVFSFTIGYDF